MGVSSVVYVPKYRLPLNSWDVCTLLRYDGIPYHTFTDNGIPEHASYIDSDVVASAVFSIVSELPASLSEFVDYYSGGADPSQALLSEYFSAVRKLKFLSELYPVLRSTAAIIIPDTAVVSGVLPSCYPVRPSDFVELRSWVEDRLGGERV